MTSDLQVFALAALVLVAIVGGVEWMHARSRLGAPAGRRIVHMTVGLLAAASPTFFTSALPVMALAAIFVPINLVAVRRRWLRGMHDDSRGSHGTVTFPLAVLFAAWWCWHLDPTRVPAFQAALVVLALADPLAAAAGAKWGVSSTFRLGGDPKSVAGSVVFFGVSLSSIAAVMQGTGFLGNMAPPAVLGVLVTAAALATVAEAMGRSGWDNFHIVLATTVCLATAGPGGVGVDRLPEAWILAAILAATTYRLRLLDAGGAAGAGLLALSIAWMAGWAWLLPGAVFFVLSSLLSRVGRRQKEALSVLPEKRGARDLVQVFSNGGVAWLAVTLPVMLPGIDGEAAFAMLCGAFAAAAADTWSTEIGSLSRTSPRLVTTGRPVQTGTSGGITPLGLLASVGGAASVASMAWIAGGPFLAIVAAGVVGGLVDSVAGATIQRDPVPRTGVDGHEGLAASARRGFGPVTNDVVNLICTAAGAVLAVALF